MRFAGAWRLMKRNARERSGALGFLAMAVAGILLAGPAAAQRLPADGAVIEGFEKVVFGAEYRGFFSDDSYVKKFAGPVRVGVADISEIDRNRAVAAFVRQMSRQIAGLDIAMAGTGERENFVVHVVDRADYQRTGRTIYRNPFMNIPGNCIVRAVYDRSGISRADAIIVSDEGDGLFRRCLIEEMLQGLGPLNENADAPQSVFNDTSRLTNFGAYDRLLLNMLYDERLTSGMSQAKAAAVLPDVLRSAKRRLRRS